MSICASASTRRPITPASQMRCRLTTRRRAVVPQVRVPAAAPTRTTTHLSASRTSRRPIVTGG
jgi:hypothetical protein